MSNLSKYRKIMREARSEFVKTVFPGTKAIGPDDVAFKSFRRLPYEGQLAYAKRLIELGQMVAYDVAPTNEWVRRLKVQQDFYYSLGMLLAERKGTGQGLVWRLAH